MAKKKLTHLDEAGRARMVDVGAKPPVRREAVAEGTVWLSAATAGLLREGGVPKGDVLAVARVAGILAAKKCGELIPLCHPLPIESVTVEFAWPATDDGHAGAETRVPLKIIATATITARTGVEMEALTAVTLAALTVYDMCKAVDKSMEIGGVRVVRKTKGAGVSECGRR